MSIPAAVIFDLDGVVIDSEVVWDDARRTVVQDSGGHWRAGAQRAMMGMSSPEWSRYMHEQLGVPIAAEEISAAVVARVQERYRRRLPLIPGAREAVAALASRWPLAIASSANRAIIALVLELAGLADRFDAAVSSEDVARGKPAPDVYLEAARRLSQPPSACVAIEDSGNGILAAASAGMSAIAIPNRSFPPGERALAHAALVLGSIAELSPATVIAAAGRTGPEAGET